VIYWLKLELRILLTSLISPKCTSGYLIQFPYISLYCPEHSSTIIGGRTRLATFVVQLIEFPDIFVGNKFGFFRNPLLFSTNHLSMTSTLLTLPHLSLAKNGYHV
jgi:hypothetical protein